MNQQGQNSKIALLLKKYSYSCKPSKMYKKIVNTQAHELTRHINKTTINEIYTVFEM